MTSQSSDDEVKAADTELEITAVGAAPILSVACGAQETPTVVPPPSDEPPPTVRWTPPPVLIARSRFDRRKRSAHKVIDGQLDVWKRKQP